MQKEINFAMSDSLFTENLDIKHINKKMVHIEDF